MNAPEFPVAEVAPAPRRSWTLALPLFALILALALLRRAWNERGPLVRVRAAEGHGLAAGDSLRTLGIEIGRVEAVALAEDGGSIEISVRLQRSARAALRAGSRYWVARPVLGVEGVRGLESALGARSLAVLPGAPGASEQYEFIALAEPPLAADDEPEALEVVLEARERRGLARGAPILFRGIAIGALVSVGLADDARAVELRARIHAPFAELVRSDSRFARAAGVGLSLGLAGLELELGSLQSLWLGGVTLATPTHPGPRAHTGQRFELLDEVAEEWSDWRPALPLGSAWLSPGSAAPERVFARLTSGGEGWFSRTRARAGWLVREGQGWLGPADLLGPPSGSERALLELGGERHELTGPPEWSDGRLARRRLGAGPAATAIPLARTLAGPEDVILCADPALAPIAVSAAHLTPADGELALSREVALDERWHGAAVLARADGAWVGVLRVEGGVGRVAPRPK
jgi:hypothetical protein